MTANQFPSDWDDDKKKQYLDFMEKAQREPKAEGKIVSLRTGTSVKARAADLVERSKKSRLALTAKRETVATGAAKSEEVFQVTDALTTIPSEFSSVTPTRPPSPTQSPRFGPLPNFDTTASPASTLLAGMRHCSKWAKASTTLALSFGPLSSRSPPSSPPLQWSRPPFAACASTTLSIQFSIISMIFDTMASRASTPG